MQCAACHCLRFFVNDTATTQIYALSLHDALPIFRPVRGLVLDLLDDLAWPTYTRELAAYSAARDGRHLAPTRFGALMRDRKSTRLNSSHQITSYAVSCLTKQLPPAHPVTSPPRPP